MSANPTEVKPILMKMRVIVWIFGPAMLVFLMACFSARPAKLSTRFADGLTCGMTLAELEKRAAVFGDAELFQPERGPERVANIKGTSVYLWLEDEQLVAYRLAWISGFTRQALSLKTFVCSGDKTVQVILVADSELVGARIWVDDIQVEDVSKFGNAIFEVGLGSHKLKVEKPGYKPYTKTVHYHEMSQGNDYLVVEMARSRPAE